MNVDDEFARTEPFVTPDIAALYGASIVDTVRDPLLLLTESLQVVLANASFCRTFEVPQDVIVGRQLYEINDGEWNIAPLRRLLEELLPERTELHDFEVEHLTRRAGTRIMLLNARRLNHPDGTARLILLAFEDVTERRRLERTLNAAMQELERSNQELQSFASIASHDLQEPLRKIRAFGERLEAVCEGALPERGRDYLARMTNAADRMQRLITDVLSLARVATAPHSRAALDLDALVADVIVDLDESIRAAGAQVVKGNLPRLDGNATQMRQLFQNLIVNALKFRGERPPRIEISATASVLPRQGLGGGEAGWRIDIVDNGIGFDQKYAERIFEPLERLHPRTAFEGTGIGLALCRRIVQRHRGSIRAESAPGTGARFIVYLPATQKDVHD